MEFSLPDGELRLELVVLVVVAGESAEAFAGGGIDQQIILVPEIFVEGFLGFAAGGQGEGNEKEKKGFHDLWREVAVEDRVSGETGGVAGSWIRPARTAEAFRRDRI